MTDYVTQGFNPGVTTPLSLKCRRHDRLCNPGFQPWAVGMTDCVIQGFNPRRGEGSPGYEERLKSKNQKLLPFFQGKVD